jgi:hypothetical protein
MIGERSVALVLLGMDQHIKNFALSIHGTPEIGHGHWGLTLGPVTGRLIAELVTGVTPFCDPAPYAAERFV